MILFNLTKRINKAVAPKLLSGSLRLHEYLSSRSSSLPFSPKISLLPLAQRLVSIEVQDDYRRLVDKDSINRSGNSPWENFVDDMWSLFGLEDKHKQLKAKEQDEDKQIEAKAEKMFEAKQQKKKHKRRHKYTDDVNMNVSGNNTAGENRVQLLNHYIRPALLPNNTSTDDNNSRHLFSSSSNSYDNFVKWLRGEYLIARYGPIVTEAVQNNPLLRDDAQGLSTLEVEQTIDSSSITTPPLKLPSVNTVKKAFDMKSWSRHKVSIHEDYDDTTQGDDKVVDTNNISIENVIHNKLRGHITHCGPLNAYFEMRKREDSYELWTREYIFGLAAYLLKRIKEMYHNNSSTIPKETILLDVGAGDGRLAYFLRRAMNELYLEQQQKSRKTTKKKETTQPSLPTVIATDDGSWRAPMYSNQFITVEKLSAFESLEKYAPKQNKERRLIVLCSWMPPTIDFTSDFRQRVNEDSMSDDTRLVEEYILIGEADNGTCGHNWYTWGNRDFIEYDDDDIDDEESNNQPQTLYERDGYKRVDLEELSSLQFSRFDCSRSKESMTVSFRHSPE